MPTIFLLFTHSLTFEFLSNGNQRKIVFGYWFRRWWWWWTNR